nr:hypothetical protein CFP56_34900 [Quercus suber]
MQIATERLIIIPDGLAAGSLHGHRHDALGVHGEWQRGEAFRIYLRMSAMLHVVRGHAYRVLSRLQLQQTHGGLGIVQRQRLTGPPIASRRIADLAFRPRCLRDWRAFRALLRGRIPS